MAKPVRAYKEVRLQQLRSFCETARLGSLTAAARALDLAQPTVWEQVHALERAFGDKLIVREAHGCRLTDTGRLLAELAAPLVAGIDSLKQNVEEARGRLQNQLTVAATPRICVEDLPGPIVDFQQQHPHVILRLLEQSNEQVVASVESGEADLGLTVESPTSPWLTCEPGYQLDLFLVTPADHPLARKRKLLPKDLLSYPLVNSPVGIPDPAITAALEKLGVFEAQPRRVEAFYTSSIRRYVELGFGVGLIVALPGHASPPHLRERSISEHFGAVTVHLVWRKGALPQGAARTFAGFVQSLRSCQR